MSRRRTNCIRIHVELDSICRRCPKFRYHFTTRDVFFIYISPTLLFCAFLVNYNALKRDGKNRDPRKIWKLAIPIYLICPLCNYSKKKSDGRMYVELKLSRFLGFYSSLLYPTTCMFNELRTIIIVSSLSICLSHQRFFAGGVRHP